MVIQYHRLLGPSSPTEVIFLLQIIQLGDNSEKLFGFGALFFPTPDPQVFTLCTVTPPSAGVLDGAPLHVVDR